MFESRVIEKTSRLRETANSDPDQADIDYLLDTIPYIREYDQVQHTASSPTTTNTIESYVDVTQRNTKHIYDQYLAHVEGDPEAMTRVATQADDDEHLCQPCATPLVYSPVDATMICPQCGVSKPYLERGNRGLTYQEQVDSQSKRTFTYKRISHFIECLNASQAKQNTSIPDDVIEAIRHEMKKHRIEPNQVTTDNVRKFLKRRGFSKYYEHVNYILSSINTSMRTSLPQHVEETLVKMFTATQVPFEQVTDSDRVNFLRYNYIIYKMLEIIGETDYLYMFPLLKSRHKLIQHDQVWKRICEHPTLQWPFIPTI
jgi:uncharacterized Zn finger protein (UPF0148 family)